MMTHTASADYVQRNEARSCDQQAEHASTQADLQKVIKQTTNAEIPQSTEPYVTRRGRTVRPPEKLDL